MAVFEKEPAVVVTDTSMGEFSERLCSAVNIEHAGRLGHNCFHLSVAPYVQVPPPPRHQPGG
eukprot:8892341-Lingulodinium_polyedra.AAC.1